MYQTSSSKGQELVAQRIVRNFIKLGHEAYLITSVYHDGIEVTHTENMEEKGYIYAEDSELGIPIIRVDSYVGKWPPRRIFFRDFIHILQRIVDEFRLNALMTHSTLWNGPEEVAKFLLWRRSMKKLGGYDDPIIFCHMSHFQEPSPKRYSLVERSFRMAWNRLTLPQIFTTANLVIVVTPMEREAKMKMGLDDAKCYLFPGGVDDETFLRYSGAGIEELLERIGVDRSVKIVTYLGSIEERKNPLAIVKIARILKDRKDIHFMIAGRGDTPYAENFRKEVLSTPNVTYLGEIDEKNKVLLLKSSYVNIIMSKMEALGLTQLESMYLGVPVITSASEGQSWLVRDGIDGIHLRGPDDVDGAAKAIVRLVENPDLREKLSTNAKERARAFTLSRLTARLNARMTEELIKEGGLEVIPSDIHSTLAEPEQVIKSWSSGSVGVVATNRRLFIRSGVVSRRVTEIAYRNITSVEHLRRYHWKTLLLGIIASLAVAETNAIEPIIRFIFSRAFASRIATNVEYFVSTLQSLLPGTSFSFTVPNQALEMLPVLPIVASGLIFLLNAREGFMLRGPGIKPVYLPYRFKGVIKLIRQIPEVEKEHSMSEIVQSKQEPL